MLSFHINRHQPVESESGIRGKSQSRQRATTRNQQQRLNVFNRGGRGLRALFRLVNRSSRSQVATSQPRNLASRKSQVTFLDAARPLMMMAQFFISKKHGMNLPQTHVYPTAYRKGLRIGNNGIKGVDSARKAAFLEGFRILVS